MDERQSQDVRAKLYTDIAHALLDSKLVAYVDRYNNQFAHLEEEKVLRYPCALIEFSDIQWQQVGRHVQRGTVLVNIYVATKVRGRTSAVGRTADPAVEDFELLGALRIVLRDLSLDYAGTFTRMRSVTDHDHDSTIVNLEQYTVTVIDTSAEPQTRRVSVSVEIGDVSIK